VLNQYVTEKIRAQTITSKIVATIENLSKFVLRTCIYRSILVDIATKINELTPKKVNTHCTARVVHTCGTSVDIATKIHGYRDGFLNLSLYRRTSGPNKKKLKERQNFNAFFHEL
jgi:hypothetical protein